MALLCLQVYKSEDQKAFASAATPQAKDGDFFKTEFHRGFSSPLQEMISFHFQQIGFHVKKSIVKEFPKFHWCVAERGLDLGPFYWQAFKQINVLEFLEKQTYLKQKSVRYRICPSQTHI